MAARTQMITGREAAAILGELDLPRETARRALLTGIAGPGLRCRGAILYEEQAVRALLRPPIAEEKLPPQMRSGTFVARVGPPGTKRGIDLTASPEQQREAVCDRWRVSWETRLVMWGRAQRDWPMPFIATVSGIAVLGATILDTEGPWTRRSLSTRLTLVDPGDWYDAIHLRRLPMGSGTARGPWTMIPPGTLLNPSFSPPADGRSPRGRR